MRGMVLGLVAAAPLTERHPDPDGAFQLHVHRDAHVWTWAAAVAIAAELRRDLELRPRSRLLVSACSRISPVFEALSRAPLDWARVDVGLTDECWLQPDDPDSRAAAVRRHLLREYAAAARLEPITQPGRTLQEAVAAANAHAQQTPNVIVLGMADDGRIAALFQDSPDYARAVASGQAYMSLDASYSPAASPWPRRITVTPAGLARAQSRILLLQGAAQRRIFDAAIAGRDASHSPLAAVHLAGGAPLQVHWHP